MQQIAELTRQDQADRLRPIVMGTVTNVGSDNEGPFVSVDLRNIGGGPAVHVPVTAEYVGELVGVSAQHNAASLARIRRLVPSQRSDRVRPQL